MYFAIGDSEMPDYKRVRYTKCPLVEVTYQLNFPAILSIEANDPVDFQEDIREKYPVYNQQIEQQNEVVVNVENAKANTIFNQQQVRRLHSFISENQQWKVTLAKDMLAFSTVKYDTWEDLSDRAGDVIDAFVKEYRPAFFTRIGLRYIDAIERAILGLNDTPWDELIQPHLCGCLGYRTEGSVLMRNSNVNAEVVFDDVLVNIASGLGTVDHHDGSFPSEAFILNCDYFISKKISITDLGTMSSKLHDRSHIFFRESITDKLHYAMDPKEIANE